MSEDNNNEILNENDNNKAEEISTDINSSSIIDVELKDVILIKKNKKNKKKLLADNNNEITNENNNNNTKEISADLNSSNINDVELKDVVTNKKNKKNKKNQQIDILMPVIKPIPFVDLSKITTTKTHKIEKTIVSEIVPLNQEKLLSPNELKEPFFQNFYREIEKFISNEMVLETGSKVLIGVSGGVDSVVLLDVMANLSDKYKFSVYVAHYNHKLRGKASDEDEKFVRNLAASYNIPYYWQNGKVQQYSTKNNISIEESARILRYLFFERISRQINADFLVTAHTADDSTETFLLNLFRGSGLTGLSGIPARRQFIKNVILFRPFIMLKKQKLIEYANKRKLEWHEDESNSTEKYTRNKIRNDLIPKLKKDYSPGIVDTINRASKLIQAADKIIHDYVKTHLPSVLVDISNDRVSIKISLFKTFDEFIRGEMLQVVLAKYFRLLPPSMNIIDRILKLCNSNTGAICEITNNIFAIRDRQVITITRKTTNIKVNKTINKTGVFNIDNLTFVLKEVKLNEIEYNNKPNIEYFDFNKISKELTIRSIEPTDEFIPLGMDNSIKINDFLSNEKVSILDKPNILVMETSDKEIIWVCKMRISNKFKIIKNQTKRILKIEIKD